MTSGVGAGELHDAVEARLRRARQRYTAGRRGLVTVLSDAPRPLSIAELLEGDGSPLSQSSVYRNLQLLEQVGVVDRIVTADETGARFELAEDLTDAHHHHLICRACGTVEDFTLPAPVEQALARAVAEAGEQTGFEADHHRFDLVGTCSGCA